MWRSLFQKNQFVRLRVIWKENPRLLLPSANPFLCILKIQCTGTSATLTKRNLEKKSLVNLLGCTNLVFEHQRVNDWAKKTKSSPIWLFMWFVKPSGGIVLREDKCFCQVSDKENNPNVFMNSAMFVFMCERRWGCCERCKKWEILTTDTRKNKSLKSFGSHRETVAFYSRNCRSQSFIDSGCWSLWFCLIKIFCTQVKRQPRNGEFHCTVFFF